MPPRRRARTRAGTRASQWFRGTSVRAGARVTKPTAHDASGKTTKQAVLAKALPSDDASLAQQEKPLTPPTTPATQQQEGQDLQPRRPAAQASSLAPGPPAVPTPELAPSTQATNAVNAQARSEAKVKYDVDEKALALPETAIRDYWASVQDARVTAHVHQEGVSLYEKILRHFDLLSKYGLVGTLQPCIGIARIRRWRRAYKLGLDPPLEVLAVLLKLEQRGEPSQMAYIDELLS
ncbi:hypothetical protein KEM52_003786 [Ascosphaera acerosa]|nr:hypothetical protein KEM52_003786 [Ascosphaera acerosa]